MRLRTVIECVMILSAASIAAADEGDVRYRRAEQICCAASADFATLSPHQWLPEYEKFRLLAEVQLNVAVDYLNQADEMLRLARQYQAEMTRAGTERRFLDMARWQILYKGAWDKSIELSDLSATSGSACRACVRAAWESI